MFRKIKLRDYDFKLVLMTIALSAVGIVASEAQREHFRPGSWPEWSPA